MAKPFRNERVFITGADGFTGKYLVNIMEQAGYEVFGTTFNRSQQSKNFQCVNLCDKELVRHVILDIKPQIVVHLAAISFVGERNISQIYETNLLGTSYLIESLSQLENKPQSILLASSASVYGNNSNEVLHEDCPPNPSNHYGISKYAMEKMAFLWTNQLPIFIVRPFNYTGVGQNKKFLIPKIVDHFKRAERSIELGNIDIWREFGDVRLVSQIYKKLLEAPPVGQVINICTGQPYSLREVIGMCEMITGHYINIEINPELVRENEIRALKGDNSRLCSLVNIDSPYSLENTLRWMLV